MQDNKDEGQSNDPKGKERDIKEAYQDSLENPVELGIKKINAVPLKRPITTEDDKDDSVEYLYGLSPADFEHVIKFSKDSLPGQLASFINPKNPVFNKMSKDKKNIFRDAFRPFCQIRDFTDPLYDDLENKSKEEKAIINKKAAIIANASLAKSALLAAGVWEVGEFENFSFEEHPVFCEMLESFKTLEEIRDFVHDNSSILELLKENKDNFALSQKVYNENFLKLSEKERDLFEQGLRDLSQVQSDEDQKNIAAKLLLIASGFSQKETTLLPKNKDGIEATNIWAKINFYEEKNNKLRDLLTTSSDYLEELAKQWWFGDYLEFKTSVKPDQIKEAIEKLQTEPNEIFLADGYFVIKYNNRYVALRENPLAIGGFGIMYKGYCVDENGHPLLSEPIAFKLSTKEDLTEEARLANKAGLPTGKPVELKMPSFPFYFLTFNRAESTYLNKFLAELGKHLWSPDTFLTEEEFKQLKDKINNLEKQTKNSSNPDVKENVKSLKNKIFKREIQVMPIKYKPGKDMSFDELYALIKDKSLLERIKIAQDLSRELAKLHEEKGLTHRDIKDKNIRFNWKVDKKGNIRWEVTLVDYGLARETSYSEGLSALAGTAEYVAPEVLRSRPINIPDSDVFSYGIIVWGLFCNDNPLNSKNAAVNKTFVYPPADTLAFKKENNSDSVVLTNTFFADESIQNTDPLVKHLIYEFNERCNKLSPEDRPSDQEIRDFWNMLEKYLRFKELLEDDKAILFGNPKSFALSEFSPEEIDSLKNFLGNKFPKIKNISSNNMEYKKLSFSRDEISNIIEFLENTQENYSQILTKRLEDKINEIDSEVNEKAKAYENNFIIQCVLISKGLREFKNFDAEYFDKTAVKMVKVLTENFYDENGIFLPIKGKKGKELSQAEFEEKIKEEHDDTQAKKQNCRKALAEIPEVKKFLVCKGHIASLQKFLRRGDVKNNHQVFSEAKKMVRFLAQPLEIGDVFSALFMLESDLILCTNFSGKVAVELSSRLKDIRQYLTSDFPGKEFYMRIIGLCQNLSDIDKRNFLRAMTVISKQAFENGRPFDTPDDILKEITLFLEDMGKRNHYQATDPLVKKTLAWVFSQLNPTSPKNTNLHDNENFPQHLARIFRDNGEATSNAHKYFEKAKTDKTEDACIPELSRIFLFTLPMNDKLSKIGKDVTALLQKYTSITDGDRTDNTENFQNFSKEAEAIHMDFFDLAYETLFNPYTKALRQEVKDAMRIFYPEHGYDSLVEKYGEALVDKHIFGAYLHALEQSTHYLVPVSVKPLTKERIYTLFCNAAEKFFGRMNENVQEKLDNKSETEKNKINTAALQSVQSVSWFSWSYSRRKNEKEAAREFIKKAPLDNILSFIKSVGERDLLNQKEKKIIIGLVKQLFERDDFIAFDPHLHNDNVKWAIDEIANEKIWFPSQKEKAIKALASASARRRNFKVTVEKQKPVIINEERSSSDSEDIQQTKTKIVKPPVQRKQARKDFTMEVEVAPNNLQKWKLQGYATSQPQPSEEEKPDTLQVATEVFSGSHDKSTINIIKGFSPVQVEKESPIEEKKESLSSQQKDVSKTEKSVVDTIVPTLQTAGQSFNPQAQASIGQSPHLQPKEEPIGLAQKASISAPLPEKERVQAGRRSTGDGQRTEKDVSDVPPVPDDKGKEPEIRDRSITLKNG